MLDKHTKNINKAIPKILKLNKNGEPIGWIYYEEAATHYFKGHVLWSMGEYTVDLRGGTNAKTGKQSVLTIDTIIAISNGTSPTKYRLPNPPLTNTTLFVRDRNICAYCGGIFKDKELTRDHIVPVSKNGRDTWENCVTSCVHCNQWKADRTPEEADMRLIYVPYTPSYNEHLILSNRRILKNQMDFLMTGVSKHSRLRHSLN